MKKKQKHRIKIGDFQLAQAMHTCDFKRLDQDAFTIDGRVWFFEGRRITSEDGDVVKISDSAGLIFSAYLMQRPYQTIH